MGEVAQGQPERTGTPDNHLALDMMSYLCPDTDRITVLCIQGEPQSKARARRGKNGAWYNASSEEEMALSAQLRPLFPEPMKGNVAVGCIFFRSNRQRIDADNMLKMVMDAATGICFFDDDQVTAQLGVIELDRERPRTVIAIGEHKSSMDRSYRDKVCPVCGASFQTDQHRAKYCSKACAAKGNKRGLKATLECQICHKPFTRTHAGQVYCGEACRREAVRVRNDNRRLHQKAFCVDCGKELSRPGYARCRACWLANVRKND